jgi:hypothetical protein
VSLPKVFIFSNGPCGVGVKGAAIAEDGTVIATWACSSLRWLQRDLRSVSALAKYSAHYPDGFELEWVGDPKAHEGCKAAITKAEARSAVAQAGAR